MCSSPWFVSARPCTQGPVLLTTVSAVSRRALGQQGLVSIRSVGSVPRCSPSRRRRAGGHCYICVTGQEAEAPGGGAGTGVPGLRGVPGRAGPQAVEAQIPERGCTHRGGPEDTGETARASAGRCRRSVSRGLRAPWEGGKQGSDTVTGSLRLLEGRRAGCLAE